MPMFLGHIAFLLASFAVAMGLVLLQFSKESKKLLTLAGWILIVVGVLGWICIGYYMVYYFRLGNFGQACPQMMHMMGPR